MKRASVLLLVLVAAACSKEVHGDPPGAKVTPSPATSTSMSLTSAAFSDGAAIPKQFTCDGDDISPPLSWSGVPSGTVELLLIVVDPDAPGGAFTHWTMWHIPPVNAAIEAGSVPAGVAQGRNDAGKNGWKGPCPPKGKPHHYTFTLIARGTAVTLQDGASPEQVAGAVASPSLGSATITGLYGRS